MEGIKYKDIDELIERVIKVKVEIELNIEPDKQQLIIRPWRPFEYSCPYRTRETSC
ncbi:MAG: hypothetical protein IJV14_06620 [Lachnospiraceae bacterium]|nr:hypothetical protein [Lachnospiraceae bacterium]